MLGSLTGLFPSGTRCVLVDGPPEQATLFASRLTEKLTSEQGAPQVTLDAGRPSDVRVFLRTAPGGKHFPVYQKQERREREERADVVIDVHDADWPVIRRVAALMT